MVWLISAKRSRYDHASAFAKFGFIDWRQNINYQVGDMVYIYPKKNRAGRKYSYYYFRPGDDAWKIAQKYGIKLKSLYKLNGIPYGTPLKTQQRLKLR